MQAGAIHDADEIGVRSPDHTPVASLGPGETGYLIAGIKDVRRGPLRRDRHRRRARRPPSAARRLPRPEADGVLRPLPDRRRPVLRPARGAREAAASTTPATPTSPRRPARSASASAAASSACSTWRSSASASSASSTSTSSPPRRRWPTSCTRPTATVVEVDNPSELPPHGGDRAHRGAVAHVHDPHAEGLHGHDHGPLPDPAGRDEEARVPLARAGGAHLQGAAGRGRRRLLRPAEEPHPGLRQPRLRARRLRARPTW